MSLALIEESAKEVRRLAIAGSPLAVGDFRLKKLVAPLEQAGAKAPVFVQVAKAISELVNGKETESASRLLNLSMLLNAILYTQGQTGATGSIAEMEVFEASCSNTRTSARVLKPLVLALTTSGGGRLETIRSAIQRNAFNDLRLIDPSIKALGDTFPEIADLVAEHILPAYGAGIVPLLKTSLDLKGKKEDGRKLKLMHQLDASGTLELCKTALADGSQEVKASAIECLGKHEDCLALVLEQAGSKNKQLRIAALRALAQYDRAEITKLFAELIKGKSLEILAEPLRVIRSKQVLALLLDEGKRVFELLLKNDPEQIPRFWEVLDCLNDRKDQEVEAFLLSCLTNSDKLTKVKAAKNFVFSGADVLSRIAGLLYSVGTKRTHEAILEKRQALPPDAFSYVLRSALRVWKPQKVYDEFSSLLGQTKGAAKEKNQQLCDALMLTTHFRDPDVDSFDEEDTDSSEAQLLRKTEIDPRWIDAAIKANELELVCALAGPGHKAAIAYLVKALEAKGQQDIGTIIEALARCGHPKVTDLFLDQVTRLAKKTTPYNYELQYLLRSACHLPKSDLPKLDEFASTLKEKVVDSFLEAIGPLRSTPPTP